MTGTCASSKTRTALFVSVAANIFLVAFTLGRFSDHPYGPPHGFDGFGPPPPGMYGDNAHRHGMHPPFFGPELLFSADEMRAQQHDMRADFAKIAALRAGFAAKLAAGPVSKDDVLQNFAAIDQVMDAVKKETQEKAAEKISTMSDADRMSFARRLADAPDMPQAGPDHGPMMPSPDQPPGQPPETR
ncbi:MAG: hypothetical protein KGI37_02440 [Alphaproteobacteria bacterium]|nr:hypothetical protein [Alphaproteobacteria bacterium]